MSLQTSLANYSFLCLLGSMILYWTGTLFEEDNSYNSLLPTAKSAKAEKQPLSNTEVKSELLIDKGYIKESENKDFKSGNQTLFPQRPLNLSLALPKAGWVEKGKEIFYSLSKKNYTLYAIFIANLLLTLLLILRWKESGHFPLSNLYESLMFLSWCFTGLHLFIETYTFSSFSLLEGAKENGSTNSINNKTVLQNSESILKQPSLLQSDKPFEATLQSNMELGLKKSNFSNNTLLTLAQKAKTRKLLGAITTPSALLTNAFATFTLPKEMQEASPLVPALQSNWLMMHVTVMILSYAALILGSLLSIAFLIVTGGKEIKFSDVASSYSYGEGGSMSSFNSIALTLDNLSYRILGIGFPFLTIGILSGAVWANEAWGSYWSWDPKETWALLTWLIFAIYLHMRLSKGWEGKKPAIIASFGFVIVWICYLGVNLIGEGLHSYGWLSQA